MALPLSGPISINAINVEFARSGTAQTSMSQLYRDGGIVTTNNTNVPTSGAISLSQFYGAIRQFLFTISSNQTNANLRTLAVNAGWDQSAPVVATINSGVYISSNSTATPALTVNGSFPGGVELVNNGFIVGMGGNGGNGGPGGLGSVGTVGAVGAGGGLALSVASSVSIRNSGTIGGGGGGGGGGSSRLDNIPYQGIASYGGGGGGGGRSSAASNSAGGVATGSVYVGSNGGAGTVSAAGNGGAGFDAGGPSVGSGGNGGGWGSSGSSGATVSFSGGAGGAGGAAVSGNSNITWLATGTRLGAIT
jgi:hypothetical protein